MKVIVTTVVCLALLVGVALAEDTEKAPVDPPVVKNIFSIVISKFPHLNLDLKLCEVGQNEDTGRCQENGLRVMLSWFLSPNRCSRDKGCNIWVSRSE